MTSEQIRQKVQQMHLRKCCYDCAEQHRDREPYDGTVTIHSGECEICHKTRIVGPARKLFGYHIFR